MWPEPVEAVLRAQPGVADVAVAGTPDDEWGHVVTAFVVPDDAGPPTLDALRGAVKDVLAAVLRAPPARRRRGHPPHRAGQGPPGGADDLSRRPEAAASAGHPARAGTVGRSLLGESPRLGSTVGTVAVPRRPDAST